MGWIWNSLLGRTDGKPTFARSLRLEDNIKMDRNKIFLM
jgi:hypothetical protein